MAIEPDDPLSSGANGAPPASPSGWRAYAVQRVQIGVIGLAAMVLLVGLANIIISNARQNEAQVVPEAASTVAPQATGSVLSDPLADVGVLPDLPPERARQLSSDAEEPGTGDALPPAPQ